MSSHRPEIYDDIPIEPTYSNKSETGRRTFWPTPENPDTVNQSETVTTTPLEASFDFGLERQVQTGTPVALTASSPDGGIWESIVRGDSIVKRRVIDRDGRHLTEQWTKYRIAGFQITGDNRLVVILDDPPSNEPSREDIGTPLDDADGHTVVSAAHLCESLADRSPTSSWHHNPAYWEFENPTTREQAYLPPGSPYEAVPSCGDMTFKEISGAGSKREIINPFLEGGPDGTVEHQLGSVNGWKAAFGAYYRERLVAVLTLEHHPNRQYFDEHNEILISRLACHPSRPANTPTWMIARARDWARDNGYDQLGAIAGVGDNRGTIYKAAGMALDEDLTGWAAGDGWTNRDGRTAVRDGSLWYRRKWSQPL